MAEPTYFATILFDFFYAKFSNFCTIFYSFDFATEKKHMKILLFHLSVFSHDSNFVSSLIPLKLNYESLFLSLSLSLLVGLPLTWGDPPLVQLQLFRNSRKPKRLNLKQ